MSHPLARNREYKPLTGEDVGLQQAIFETERGQRTFEAFACWVNAHIGRAQNLGTDSLRLFVGCKSGQHRSVALLCRFARLRKVETGPCETAVVVSHRDRDRCLQFQPQTQSLTAQPYTCP